MLVSGVNTTFPVTEVELVISTLHLKRKNIHSVSVIDTGGRGTWDASHPALYRDLHRLPRMNGHKESIEVLNVIQADEYRVNQCYSRRKHETYVVSKSLRSNLRNKFPKIRYSSARAKLRSTLAGRHIFSKKSTYVSPRQLRGPSKKETNDSSRFPASGSSHRSGMNVRGWNTSGSFWTKVGLVDTMVCKNQSIETKL